MKNNVEEIWFDKLENQLKNVQIYPDPRRRKRMWEEHIVGNTIDHGVVMEFGVASGGSIGWFPKHILNTVIYGFDSFLGLPEDWDLGTHVLKKGHFSTGGKVPPLNIDYKIVNFIVGWFEETLPPFLNEMKDSIKILHIDSDLYSPCKFILDSVKHRFKPGTFILFDELTHFPDHGEYHHMRQHEYKAFMEFCDENPSFDFEVVARTTGPQVAIKVLKV